MAKIVQVYAQDLPAVRFIGKQYGDDDRVDGGFGRQWDEWFRHGWFDQLTQAAGGGAVVKALYEDGDATVGLMRWMDGQPFQYWVGLFLPADTPVPDGFGSVDFPASRLGTCWLKGAADAVFGQEHVCAARLEQEGMTIVTDAQGAWWFFERYGCPRFTTPDEDGEIILDICHFIA